METTGGQKGVVVAVCRSDKKGERKKNIKEGILIKNYGIEKDAHAGDWHRQVSLLAQESIDKMRAKGLDVKPGDFAENITVRGINLFELPVGSKLQIGEDVLIEISQKGKECHERCAIYYQAGDCVMPREGVFGIVLKGGIVRVGDNVVPLSD